MRSLVDPSALRVLYLEPECGPFLCCDRIGERHNSRGVAMIVFKGARKLAQRSELHSQARGWSALSFLVMLTTSMDGAMGQAANAEAGSAASRHRFLISVLSSRPDMVSGGDALVRVDVPRSAPLACVRVFRNDDDVTAACALIPAEHALQGLVNGFELG